MSDRTYELAYGLTGQTFAIYPPEAIEGIPSSATCAVYAGDDSYDEDAEFSPSVTVDSVAVTFDAASGYSQTNRRRANLGATTGVTAGVAYLVANAYGQREIVTPLAVAAADYADMDADLAYDYASSDTLKGIRLTCTVDSTWVQEERSITPPGVPSYRVLWTYTIASKVRKHYTYLRVVRQIPKHNVTIADLRKYYDDLPYELEAGARGTGARGLIDAGWDDVRLDLLQAGYKPEQLRDTETVDKLVVFRTLALMARKGQLPSSRSADQLAREWEADYQRLYQGMVNAVLKVPIDVGGEGAIAREPIAQPWFRR